MRIICLKPFFRDTLSLLLVIPCCSCRYGCPAVWSRDDGAGIWVQTKNLDHIPTIRKCNSEPTRDLEKESTVISAPLVPFQNGIPQVSPGYSLLQ